jgi:tRNA (adenine57-N1/adenine58-N1)-methyltransferase
MSTPTRSVQSGPFRAGDRVQLTGPKGRMHTVTLEPGKVFHSHKGVIPHDELIGLPDGSVVANQVGIEYLALRPLLSDFVMSMPRGAAIVYPKDAAQILAQADIFPGATVVEAGVGSGALSLWLLRAIGAEGRLMSFERREEFADVARGNVETFYGSLPANWSITLGDLADALPETADEASVDRVVLDMLAPWEVLGSVTDALKPGGVLLCYIATATQLSRVAEAIRATGSYTEPAASETMVRGWHVQGLAVRPDHRMIAHTGFLLTARRLAPDTVLPELKRRPSKTDFSDADVEAWTPGALGDRSVSDKSLRKRVRAANAAARLARETPDEPTPDEPAPDEPEADAR